MSSTPPILRISLFITAVVLFIRNSLSLIFTLLIFPPMAGHTPNIRFFLLPSRRTKVLLETTTSEVSYPELPTAKSSSQELDVITFPETRTLEVFSKAESLSPATMERIQIAPPAEPFGLSR